MKLLVLAASLASLPCIAQQPRPVAAPDYHIPLPEKIAAVRSADALPKIEDAWEDAFFRCLLTEDDRARMARFLELIATTPKEQFAAGSRAFQRMDGMGLTLLRNSEKDFYWKQYGRLAREVAVKEAAGQTGKETVRLNTFSSSTSGNTPPRKALEGWAEVAPLDAAKWIEDRNDPIASDTMMLRPLVLGWAVSDLNAATKHFLSQTKPGSREFLDTLPALRDFVLVRSLIPGLMEWFNSLPDEENEPNAKSAAFTLVLQRVEGAGMDEAIRFLDGVSNRKLITETVVSRFASQWAAKGKSLEVMKWALAQPKDDKGNRAGVSAVAQVWAGKDAKGFSHWLLENRELENLDQVLFGFVKHLAGRDITEARRWIKEIKSPTLRKEAEDSL